MNRQTKQGNILVSALLMLITMNLLGIGLVQASIRGVDIATYKSASSGVFYVTESCTQDGINYLRTLTTPLSANYDINQDDLTYMYTGNESSQEITKLSQYSFNCQITSITTKAGGPSDSTNQALNNGTEYGTSGNLSPKYYYQIQSNGSGPKSASRTINTIVSVQW